LSGCISCIGVSELPAASLPHPARHITDSPPAQMIPIAFLHVFFMFLPHIDFIWLIIHDVKIAKNFSKNLQAPSPILINA
jgi:hypothetical protein